MSRSEAPHVLRAMHHSDIVFEQAAIGMALVDFDGAFLAVNPALCELVGRSEDELLCVTWQSITHQDDVAPGQERILKAIAGEERTFQLPKRYLRPDGGVVWALLSVSVIRSELGEPLYLLTQVVDMTEQRRADEEIARLASIVESSDDAILSKDLEGTILSWNRAAERMYGFEAAEVIGRSVAVLIPADRHEELEELLGLVRRGGSVRNFETVRLRKDTSPIHVSETLSPICDAAGVPVRASSIARDITAQKHMSAELDRSLAAIELAPDEARQSEARSRRFLSDAAHHLRNPVAGIRACAETLLRGADPAGCERLLAEIARETSHVSRLVDRLLRIARLEQGDPLKLNACDIKNLCLDEAERAESLAPHLSIVVDVDEPSLLNVDADAVREILGNLLENARRHAVGRIDASVVQGDDIVSVYVCDDGPGLADGVEAEAFEPFVSLDGKGGSGLGLALSRALARAHGGDLTYEDRTFVVRFPASAG